MSRLHGGGEGRPLLRGERQPRPIPILGVTDGDRGGGSGYFDAVAIAEAVAGLAPAGASQAGVLHIIEFTIESFLLPGVNFDELSSTAMAAEAVYKAKRAHDILASATGTVSAGFYARF
jgi:hypothetical protein